MMTDPGAAICGRLGFSSTIEAVAWAARRGLV